MARETGEAFVSNTVYKERRMSVINRIAHSLFLRNAAPPLLISIVHCRLNSANAVLNMPLSTWKNGSLGKVRTCGQAINSRLLYH